MKMTFAFILLSLGLQACTCTQLTPQEREEMRERRAEMRAVGLRPGARD
jgi:hypothetical protein